MHYKITAPVGHTGLVAGVYFTDGHATCCHPPMGAVEFLRRHGYTVVAVDPDPCLDEGEVVIVDEQPTTKTTRTRRKTSTATATTTTAAESG